MLQWWDVDELLASRMTEPLVPGFLYRDTLARIFGPAGGGKTFLALDIALHVALGRPWCGDEIEAAPVVYVAAEGQAVLHERFRAWTAHHHVSPDALRGRFVTVPHAVPLVESTIDPFVARCRSLGAGLVILDTKNALMVGEENSATDVAAMRRALDKIRTASGACVVLIDHTGHSATDRARGSSAGTAAMDTEISVSLTAEPGAPATVTASTARDKAAPGGDTERRFRLRMAPPAAVLVADTAAARVIEPGWQSHPIPAQLREVTGRGAAHVPTLARYMAAYALGDTGNVGMTRAEALRAIGVSTENRSGCQAWSQLLEHDWIEPADGVKSATGRHRWAVEQTPGITPLGSLDDH